MKRKKVFSTAFEESPSRHMALIRSSAAKLPLVFFSICEWEKQKDWNHNLMELIQFASFRLPVQFYLHQWLNGNGIQPSPLLGKYKTELFRSCSSLFNIEVLGLEFMIKKFTKLIALILNSVDQGRFLQSVIWGRFPSSHS